MAALALAQDNNGSTALHYAALSGSALAIERTLAIPGMAALALARNNGGSNVLHCAALSGSALAIERTLAIPGMAALAQDNTGSTALHYAAQSGSALAILHLYFLNVGFDPATKNNIDHDAYWYADGSKNPQKTRLALALIEADLKNRRREKIGNTVSSLASGALMGGIIAYKVGAIVTTSTFLGICCVGAVGVLLLALLINCVKNHRCGFFEPSANKLKKNENAIRYQVNHLDNLPPVRYASNLGMA
jgi:ankyrin repeat protein